MDGYVFQLAMAALFGASTVAISAYIMHRKTLTQLLEFARAVERDREDEQEADFPNHLSRRYGGGQARRKGNGYRRRGSSSLPDVTSISGEDKRNGPITVQGIPAGLPPLHAVHGGIDELILQS